MARADDPHEWLSIEDPDELRTWVFDLTFLMSNWSCIYFEGCPGVLTEAAPELMHGCCSYGAHFSEDEDRERIEAKVRLLGKDEWQLRKRAGKTGAIYTNKEGDTVSKVVDMACIFLNRAGFEGGAGCALHAAALRRGESPLDWKPEVCWQLPLRRHDESDNYGYVTSTLREWKRRDWGPGGEEFHWWCTESAKKYDAFRGSEPVYKASRDEIIRMTSPKAYELLVEAIESRVGWVPLPHPALKTRRKAPK
jgi:hypothetical protein